MPIPTSVADLSATASSNYPAGSESPTVLDDYHRALCAIVRQVSDASNEIGEFVGSGSGSLSVRTKKVTGTTSASVSGSVAIAHGVTLAKILNMSVLVTDWSGNVLPPRQLDPSRDYTVVAAGVDIYITNGSTATDILSRPVVIYITYEA